MRHEALILLAVLSFYGAFSHVGNTTLIPRLAWRFTLTWGKKFNYK
ncbi:MAG: hypothetical protein HY253_10615 [Burkholderiales bacterium]|nr:hypothetical protein [Burkholderiales bacterium]